MKTLRRIVAVLFLAGVFACQGQYSGADPNNPATPPGEQYLDLIGDTIVPSPELRRLLQESLQKNPHVKSITPIPRPFRDALPILKAYKIRCNIAPNQTFIAEKTKIEADRLIFGRLRLTWYGKLINTGKPTIELDDNIIVLRMFQDTTVAGGYTLYNGYLQVHLADRYDIDGDKTSTSSTWFITHSDPTEIVAPPDSVIIIPKKPQKSH